jgi:hypothetical protein
VTFDEESELVEVGVGDDVDAAAGEMDVRVLARSPPR